MRETTETPALSLDTIATLERLEQQATKGPWEAYEGEHGRTRRYWDVLARLNDGDKQIPTLTICEMADLRDDAVNAEFISAVRNAAQALLALARRQVEQENARCVHRFNRKPEGWWECEKCQLIAR